MTLSQPCGRCLAFLSLQLEQKVVASEIFKGKKDNYPQSVPRLFLNTRLSKCRLGWTSFGAAWLPTPLTAWLFLVGNEELNSKVLQVLGDDALKVSFHPWIFSAAAMWGWWGWGWGFLGKTM